MENLNCFPISLKRLLRNGVYNFLVQCNQPLLAQSAPCRFIYLITTNLSVTWRYPWAVKNPTVASFCFCRNLREFFWEADSCTLYGVILNLNTNWLPSGCSAWLPQKQLSQIIDTKPISECIRQMHTPAWISLLGLWAEFYFSLTRNPTVNSRCLWWAWVLTSTWSTTDSHL